MSSLATHAATAAPPPMTPAIIAFYATAATVIPVLFLAIAVQGRTYETLLNNAIRAAALDNQSAQPSRPWYKTILTETRFLWPATAAGLVLVYGALGELAAILILQNQADIGAIQTFVGGAVILLTVVAAAGPAQMLAKSARTIGRQLDPGDSGTPHPETSPPSSPAEPGKTDPV